ncbi:unnamed protein product, partial [Heterotrigona itama]
TYVSYMKLVSKFAVGIPTGLNAGINTPLGYFWRIMRVYALKPEVLVCGAILAVILFYMQAVDVWSRSLLGKIQYTLGRTTSKVSKLQFLVDNSVNNGVKLSWELKQGYIAAYAVQGHRANMEDRFVVNEDMNNTGVSLFAIFDGHGGEFAANYARDKLVPNINKKVIELKDMIAGKAPHMSENTNKNEETEKKEEKSDTGHLERKKSFRKTVSTSLTDDCMKKNVGVTDPELLDKLDSLPRPITREIEAIFNLFGKWNKMHAANCNQSVCLVYSRSSAILEVILSDSDGSEDELCFAQQRNRLLVIQLSYKSESDDEDPINVQSWSSINTSSAVPSAVDFFTYMVEESNRYYDQNREKYKMSDKILKWKSITLSKIKKFRELIILMGQ